MICFGKSDGALVEVSLADITQRPERFHGRHVRVAGFITLRHEGTSIYPSDGARTAEGLWLAVETLPGGCRALFMWLREAGKGCAGLGLIEGILRRECRGHFGLWPAGIDPVTLLAVGESNAEWPERDWALEDEAWRRYLLSVTSQLRQVATDILSGDLGLIEGSRLILEFRGHMGVDFDDGEFRPLQDLTWSTLHLPIGRVRQYWATDALRDKDTEIREVEEGWRESIHRSCRLLLDRFKLPNE